MTEFYGPSIIAVYGYRLTDQSPVLYQILGIPDMSRDFRLSKYQHEWKLLTRRQIMTTAYRKLPSCGCPPNSKFIGNGLVITLNCDDWKASAVSMVGIYIGTYSGKLSINWVNTAVTQLDQLLNSDLPLLKSLTLEGFTPAILIELEHTKYGYVKSYDIFDDIPDPAADQEYD